MFLFFKADEVFECLEQSIRNSDLDQVSFFAIFMVSEI